jgi:prevent-host-death family protein
MDEISIEAARPKIGEIVDRAHWLGLPTRITRQGKPAAVVVSAAWYEAAKDWAARAVNLTADVPE